MSHAADWLGSQLPAMEAALGALVEHNSFTGNREGGQRVVRLLEDVFAMPGLEGERVGSERFADHLISRSTGKPGVEPIALIGHLDTVFPPGTFEGYRVAGNLRRGPGVLDMKGGLVVIAWALKAIASTVGLNAIAPLRLVIVSDEEVGSPEGAPLLRLTIAGSQLALVFESGSNQWRQFDSWSAPGVRTRALYFHPGGRLSFTPPTGGRANAADRFVSDPADPVPYRKRPIEATYASTGSRWSTWLLQDQRFIGDRKDVLHWTTVPLTKDVVVAGDILAKLFVSTTGQDADWVVKLIDVYPDTPATPAKVRGYQLMVSNDVLRSRFRESFETPTPMTPNTVTPITVDLHTQSYRFLKGHRIMVQVQSSWFPIIDRNPQTWVPNIFEATEADFKAQTHSVWRTPSNASRVELQVLPR